MSKKSHGWIVDTDCYAESVADSPQADTSDDATGTVGPRGISDAVRARLRLLRGNQVAHRWRCKDADGEVYYEGRYVGPGDERMFSPLEDFAMPNAGATTIEYLSADTGAWEAL